MTIAQGFLYTVALLEFGGVVGYIMNGQGRLALIWTCYAVATVALAGVTR